MNNKLRGYVRPDGDDTRVEAWGWPEMEVEAAVETNALGYSPDWYQQEEEVPVEEPVPEPTPSITAEELEAIRQAAWDEGMVEGQATGFAKGLEEGKLEGLQQGHQAGLEQGKEEGLALAREQVEQQQLISLVMQLARTLMRHEAETSPRILLEALKQGLALLPAAEQGVTLMLHPDDIARVEQAFGVEECAKRHWRLQSDPTLSPGDLQLATELSSVDLTLQGRIDQLLRSFLRDNASRDLPSN
ncbi:flagellar assembly protein FliH [Aeromonas salmonicida]|uniref:flagellar assembly protein FliH n=1 Tax=Aeromonas salmonicida TaxID=645 RepID=UPI00309801AA